MLEIYPNALPTQEIYARWEQIAQKKNCGAFCLFVGIVRDEKGIEGLSFDLYEPLLRRWFARWEQAGEEKGAIICMAHSRGDVLLGESSYMSAILSSNRSIALGLYEQFIQDFKSNAPIWKYDLIEGKRIYAKERSHPLKGGGIFR